MAYVIVTIPSGKVASDLSNFPVYVDLADMPSDFWSGVSSDGGDIRVKTTGGTVVPTDLVTIDTAGHTGALFFKASTVAAASNTVYHLHYNTGLTALAVDDANGRNAVWSDYKFVSVLAGTDPKDADRTGNLTVVDHGTLTYPGAISKGGGGGMAITKSDSNFKEFGTLGTRSDYFTLGVTAVLTDKSTSQAAIAIYNSATNYTGVNLHYSQPAGSWVVYDYPYNDAGVNGLSAAVDPSVDVSYRLNATYNFTTNRKIYVDGVLKNTDAGIVQMAQIGYNKVLLGHGSLLQASWLKLGGKVAFAYLRYSVLSADWIAAEYSNINAPSSFYSITTPATPLPGQPIRSISRDINATLGNSVSATSKAARSISRDINATLGNSVSATSKAARSISRDINATLGNAVAMVAGAARSVSRDINAALGNAIAMVAGAARSVSRVPEITPLIEVRFLLVSQGSRTVSRNNAATLGNAVAMVAGAARSVSRSEGSTLGNTVALTAGASKAVARAMQFQAYVYILMPVTAGPIRCISRNKPASLRKSSLYIRTIIIEIPQPSVFVEIPGSTVILEQ